MYLKSLVLKGFKSFADRSVLSLEPGITAIVGPNGSGKSNISDAVLWVLGERNARHLRGQAMEDVIFAGSSARKPTGLAEVDLVLDNSDNTLPVDFDEVTITRRMYRSGESEYLINGAIVRRMDVLDILHDSGLGTGTHSIISQGALDSILQSKPEDRRALIEEAAGVLKHKQRKARSERKLATMDQHVARVRDVVGEVAHQLGPLERRAKKAHVYQEVAGNLAEANLRLAVDDLRSLQEEWNSSQDAEQQLSDAVDAGKRAVEEAEAAVEDLQERIRQENADTGELSRLVQRASSTADRIDSTALVIRERRRAALARAGELQVSLDAENAGRTRAASELDKAEASLAEAQEARTAADARKDDLERRHNEAAEQREEHERDAAALDEDARSLEESLADARREYAQTQDALSGGLAHMKVIESHSTELDLQLARAQADAKSAAAEAEAADEATAALDEQEAAARKLVGTCVRARDATRTALDEAQDAERSLEAQIQALEEVERASIATAGPARAWLDEHAAQLGGSLEPLAHVLHVRNGREDLVESLLGSDISMLLVDDAAGVLGVAAALADADSEGEVALALRTGATDADAAGGDAPAPRSSAYPPDAPGTPLIGDLEYPDQAARAVVAMLGDVIVCDTLEEALRAHEADALGLRFAAEDGSVVWPSGKVMLGHADSTDADGMLARVRHIDELRAGLLDAKEATRQAKEQAGEAEESLRDAQKSSLDLSQKLAELRGNAEAARAQAVQAEEKLSAVRREIEGVEQNRADAQAQIDKARPDVQALEDKIRNLQRQIDDAKGRRDEVDASLVPARQEEQRLADDLSQAQLQATRLAEREAHLARERDARVRDLEQAARHVEESSDLLAVKSSSAQRLEPLLAVFDELARSARRRTHDLEERESAAQDSSAGLHAEASEARTAAREAHEEYDQASERLAAARVEKGRLELQVEAAINVIEQDCDTTLEHALELPRLEDRSACEEEAARLRRRIANLGTINPDAAEEYDEIKTRYDYLAGQLEDLDAARKALAKINRVIDTRMKDDFARTFEEVDAAFQDIFATLFPGGQAHLSLDDPEDLENTGVEVNAQPAGKRISKMTLLSGGEKSLTALALLFAVYRTRSTPFYILDEVEAALDDVNLRRLVGYIDELRNSTQLIMITHQRRTMEMADVLFGVSMQADGVTKVISQKIASAADATD